MNVPMIRLRSLEEGDRSRLRFWRNKPEVRRWMFSSHVISSKEHDRWFDELIGGGRRQQWIVLWREEPVGSVYLTRADARGEELHIGIYIAEESARGTGVAKAALELLLDEAFRKDETAMAVADVLPGNERAARIYRQVGMKAIIYDTPRPEDPSFERFGISRVEWQALRINQGDDS